MKPFARIRRTTLAATTTAMLVAGPLAATALLTAPPPMASAAAHGRTVTVRVNGGHDTDPRDAGRPVALVAGALGVPAQVFRTAFTGVDPAPAGQQPDPNDVRANKAALLAVLAPYGVTNDRLDAVSDEYRYQRSAGQMWPTQSARAQAVVRGGKVVSVTLLAGGSGYSSTPTITVPGVPSAKVTVTVGHSTDFAANGTITGLTLTHG